MTAARLRGRRGAAIDRLARQARIGAAVIPAWLLGLATAARAAPCDEHMLARLDLQLATIDDMHATIALMGLRDACLLPPAIDDAVRKVLMASDDDVALTAGLDVAAADPALWQRACPGGPRVIAELGRAVDDPGLGPRSRAQTLWTGCGMARLGVATADEWARAGNSAILGIAAAQWLRDAAKLSPARLRAYTRALAGLDDPVAPPLAEQYPDDGLGENGAAPLPATPPHEVRSPPPKRPRPAERRAGPRMTPGSIELRLSSSLGRTDLAAQYAATLQAERGQLEPCFDAFPAGLPTTLGLVIAGGVAQHGELVSRRMFDPVTRAYHTIGDPQLERCLLARIGRIQFARFSAPIKLELTLSTGVLRGPAAPGPAPPSAGSGADDRGAPNRPR